MRSLSEASIAPRYFANQRQRTHSALHAMLFRPIMADTCRATLGETAFIILRSARGEEIRGRLPLGWNRKAVPLLLKGEIATVA